MDWVTSPQCLRENSAKMPERGWRNQLGSKLIRSCSCRVDASISAVGTFLAKADGVLAGLAVADEVGPDPFLLGNLRLLCPRFECGNDT